MPPRPRSSTRQGGAGRPPGDRSRQQGDRPDQQNDRSRQQGDRTYQPSDRPRQQGERPYQPGDRPRQQSERSYQPSDRPRTGDRPPRSAERARQQRPRPPRPEDSESVRNGNQYDVVFGKHSVRAAFGNRPGSIRRMVMREGAAKYLQEFIDLAATIDVEPELVRSGEFLRMGELTEDDKHQGLFIVTDPLKIYSEYDFDLLNDASVIIVLDQVNNPQNFGTIIRTAAFFGADAVVWLKDRAVDITPTVSRVAVGGTEMIKLFRVTNLARSLEMLQQRGFWVYGFDERGERTLAETAFDPKTVVIIGAEGEGMRQRTKEICDELVRIPGGRPGLESLNAAVAAAVVMAELFR